MRLTEESLMNSGGLNLRGWMSQVARVAQLFHKGDLGRVRVS